MPAVDFFFNESWNENHVKKLREFESKIQIFEIDEGGAIDDGAVHSFSRGRREEKQADANSNQRP